MKPELIIICGPTGSGKSNLAFNLAKQLNTQIVYADSLAIYKNLDIGTAKPTKQEMESVVHHLVNVCNPTDDFSVSDYENLALNAVNSIISNNKPAIICGGTGFYINSLLYKMSYGNTSKNLDIRNKFMNLATNNGVDAVYNELLKVDEETAKKLHKNDLVRVVRALEIYYSTGKKKSMQNDKETPRFSYLAYSIDMPRDVLYKRINARVDKMFEDGLVNEVKTLIDSGITINNQCMQGIGYKEIYDGILNGDLETAKELVKLNSRHYAKRQITFFKKLKGLKSLPLDFNEQINTVIKDVNEFNK